MAAWKDIPYPLFWPETSAESLAALLRTLPEGAIWANVGTFCGRGLASVADVIRERKHTVYAVDLFEGDWSFGDEAGVFRPVNWQDVLNTLRQSLEVAGIAQQVHVLQASSLSAARCLSEFGVELDAAFIDADHEYASVRDDIAAWRPLLKPHGLLMGHDWADVPTWGVKRAVVEACPDYRVAPLGEIWYIPNPALPEPRWSSGYWQDIAGWFTEGDASALRLLLMTLPYGGITAHVGLFAGRHLAATADVIARRGLSAVGIDSFAGSSHGSETFDWTACRKVCAAHIQDFLGKRGVPIRLYQTTSQAAAMAFGLLGERFHLVFLDADHSHQAIHGDIASWKKRLVPGGILCGHDYALPEWPGVKRAVDELCPGAKVIPDSSVWWFTEK